jgi:hypothetical protein
MTRPVRFDPTILPASALMAALALLGIPACGTQEIRTEQVVLVGESTDLNQGGLLVTVAPAAATYEEAQAETGPSASEPEYHLLVDGKELVYDDPVQPVTVGGGGTYSAGFYAAGVHRFTLVSLDGPTVFDAHGAIASGAVNRLYVFGPPNALQARFVTRAVAPPSGQVHLSAINLVRSGVQIELVSCSDATTCTPVSPPLGLGYTFDADLPASGGSAGGESSLSSSGAGYGYRQVATASLPNPPVLSMMPADAITSPASGRAPTFIAAPIYLAADGSVLASSL